MCPWCGSTAIFGHLSDVPDVYVDRLLMSDAPPCCPVRASDVIEFSTFERA